MRPQTEQGVLVLADISGFTRFLSETELEHAHDILSEILQLVVGRLTPTLHLAEVEGDAVFAFAPQDRFPRGETLLELVEQTYCLFLGRVESIRLHTTCSCSACSAVPVLDLKFVIHTGEYIVQALGSGKKPMGSSVNLAHRLLKNQVQEQTGWKAYAMITESAARHLAIPTSGMHPEIEHYENFEPIQTFSFDLRQRWAVLQSARRVHVGTAEADIVNTVDLPAPPEVVWDWLNDPRLRSQWFGLTNERPPGPDGRSGVGTTTHCTHGEQIKSVHTIVDWHPFEYYTEEISRPSDGRRMALNTVEIESIPEGTRLHDRYRVLMTPRLLSVPFFRMARPSQQAALGRLAQLVVPPSPPATDRQLSSG